MLINQLLDNRQLSPYHNQYYILDTNGIVFGTISGNHEYPIWIQGNKGTDLACSFLSDVMYYTNEGNSPLYVCSLDAKKCFDRIWHVGLFYKLLKTATLPSC